MENDEEAGSPSLEGQVPPVPDKGETTGKVRRRMKDARDRTRRANAGEDAAALRADEVDQANLQEQAAQLADLSDRMAAIEIEVAGLRSRAETASREGMRSRPVPLTPPYVARAVVAVEDHLADMERFAATGIETAAQQAKAAAAMRCCSTLRRLCDDDDFHQTLVSMKDHLEQLRSSPLADSDNLMESVLDRIHVPGFLDIEIQMLQVAGLPEILAQRHIDVAVKAFERNPESAVGRLMDPMAFLGDLRQLRDSSCMTADLISQSVRRHQTRDRLKKLLVFGLSGTLVAVVNGIGTAVLGPAGVAASGALGSAAVGVAVQLLS